MDIKWSSDLVSLLRTHKPHQILISCKGSDSTFGAYQNAVTSHFAQTPVAWKRSGKTFPFPLTFPIRFVQYDESLCFGPQMTYESMLDVAFVHIFYINSASVEEYRSSVRHNVSEWFARLNTSSDLQWLIVVDSTRAKEKKNRALLMDKIKADFSKHTSRLIEVSESVEHGSFQPLVQSIQAAIISHLDILVGSWETALGNMRDRAREPGWNLNLYYLATMEFGRLFWSLGALEQAMTIYDDLDRFIYQLVADVIDGPDTVKEYAWVKALKAADFTVCSSLNASFHLPLYDTKKDSSFAGLRHYLMSQQVLLAFYMYQSRLRSRGAGPSIRVDFAVLVLKYVQHAHYAVTEQSNLLKILVSPYRLASWSILLIGEALHLCGLLSDPFVLDGATSALCALQRARFKAMLLLNTLPEKDEVETMKTHIDWLSQSDSPNAKVLCEVLESSSVYANHLQKAFDAANLTLLQWSRSRQAAHLSMEYAKWLRKHERSDAAISYEERFLAALLEDALTQSTLELVKQAYGKLKREEEYVKLLSYGLLIAMHDEDKEVRECFTTEWIRNLQNKPDDVLTIRLDQLMPIHRPLFSASISSFSGFLHCPGGKMTMDMKVTSFIPSTIPSVRIIVSMRQLDETTMSRRTKPVFEMNYNTRDRACRMLSPFRGRAFDPPGIGDEKVKTIELTSENFELSNGVNEVAVASDVDIRGIYVMDSVRVELVNGSMIVPIEDVQSTKPVVVFVQNTPNKLWLEENKDLLAGVVQYVDVVMEAGSTVEASNVIVRPAPSGSSALEFMSPAGEWSSTVSLLVPALEKGAKHRLRLPLCLQLDSRLAESVAVRKEKMCFEWQERIWTVEVGFITIVVITWKTSLLENRVLFELEMSRVMAEQYTLELNGAVLEVVPSDSKQPNKLARLLNTSLGELIPNIVFGVVWVLPEGTNTSEKHILTMDYRVKSKLNVDGASDKIVERDFKYRDELNLNVPKVGYELCTQILSHQPGAQLCRAGAPCDLVVSLRSLTYAVEMLYIVLEADNKLWTLNERAKILQVKESGLGQMAFSVIPCAAGFLPYPSVAVFSCQTVGSRPFDGQWTEGVDILPGSQLVSFQRTAGKQIRVLAASQGDVQVERKQGLKQKFVKLFD